MNASMFESVGAPQEGSGRSLPAAAVWALPAGALLIALHWLFPVGPRTPEGIARQFTSPFPLFVGEYLLFLGGFVVLLVGVMALADYLAGPNARRWSRTAGILSVTAIAVFLPGIGIPTIAFPGLGDLFLSGHPEVGIAIDAFSRGHFGPSVPVELLVMLAISIAGAVAMGTAAWRSRAIPRWSSIVYPIGFVLNMTDTPGIAWVGLALLVVSGTFIARQASRA
jgi:hypothetical protein